MKMYNGWKLCRVTMELCQHVSWTKDQKNVFYCGKSETLIKGMKACPLGRGRTNVHEG